MKNNKAKKYILIGACVILALLVILSIIALALSKIADRTKEIPELDYDFYTPDYDLDIKDYPEYLELDRDIHYTNEVRMQKAVTEESCVEMGRDAIFFYNYIKAIKDGDHKAYNSMLHEEYTEVHGKKDKFTKQMVYNIELEWLGRTEVDASTDAVTYSLEYCIYRNDGTFRRDIGEGSRKQFITVFYDLSTGEGKIHSLKNEYTVVK